MMQETIQTISKAEDDAKKLVIDAQIKAEEAVKKAEADAKIILKDAAAAGKVVVRERMEEAEKKADAASAQYANGTTECVDKLKADASAKKADAVKAVLELMA